MARIGIVHSTLNLCGGSELVCLHTIKALKDSGHEVYLYTFDSTDWSKVRDLTNMDVKPDYEFHFLRTELPPFGLYQRFLSGLPLLIQRGNLDLIINTHGDILPISSDITYIHLSE